MKKLVLIDDEPLARSIVLEYLTGRHDIEVVAECNNGFEGVKAIQQYQPDLVILDIQMPKINGFEMLELLDKLPSVIFATAFDEYAIKAFENNAVDYLLKPFSKERFNTALDKWSARKKEALHQDHLKAVLDQPLKQPEEKNRIVVRANGEISIIPVHDVHYIEAFDDYVKLFTKDNYFLKKKTMSYYEETLDAETFFRAHRSFIINLNELSRIEPLEKNSYIALLRSGKKIPLSRTGYSRLKEKLGI
jgi:two-component system LytT family response regulator